jgi:hypothetical protein
MEPEMPIARNYVTLPCGCVRHEAGPIDITFRCWDHIQQAAVEFREWQETVARCLRAVEER